MDLWNLPLLPVSEYAPVEHKKWAAEYFETNGDVLEPAMEMFWRIFAGSSWVTRDAFEEEYCRATPLVPWMPVSLWFNRCFGDCGVFCAFGEWDLSQKPLGALDTRKQCLGCLCACKP